MEGHHNRIAIPIYPAVRPAVRPSSVKKSRISGQDCRESPRPKSIKIKPWLFAENAPEIVGCHDSLLFCAKLPNLEVLLYVHTHIEAPHMWAHFYKFTIVGCGLVLTSFGTSIM